MRIKPLCNLPFDAVECSAAYKQDVSRVYVNVILVGMLTSTLWRNVNRGSFQQFQQSLLHAFATHVARNAWVIALSGNLVNLVNEDDAAFGCRHIIIGHLQQSAKYALNILAHISRLGKHRCVYDGKRHVE